MTMELAQLDTAPLTTSSAMSTEQQQLEDAIAAVESQRAVLGNVVVDAMLAGVRAKLASLSVLVPLPESHQTLRQVTILFMDIVGSTPLSLQLDPEEFHSIVNGVLVRGTTVIETHGGKIVSYAGDNLIAVFGAVEARENSAESAVRAGLSLLEVGRMLHDEVLLRHGIDASHVRVGIHTGPALLGGGVQADNTLSGLSVNIAARMEQTAGSGALRISHDTYSHVRGLFEVEQQAPLAVKGVNEPMVTYLVIRAKPRSFRLGTRGIEGIATRIIGRAAEVAQLQDAFRRLFTDRALAVVTVVAEEGVGKSRLLYEFETWSETQPEEFFVFRGRADPHTEGQPFGLLRDIIAWRFQILDDDTVAEARRKLEQGIIPLFMDDDGVELAEGHAHLLGHLIGIEYRESRHIRGILDDAKQIRNRALHAAAQLFRRMSCREGLPVVLQLEDLHWADNESLDFLNFLCEVNRDVALLILSFSRPSLFERRTDWPGIGGIHQRINLRPLDNTDSRLLANELLKKLPEVPAALRELVTGGSEGNPFYMEELVKMLIDRGAIQTKANGWTLNAEKLLSTQVPSTLTGVLQARLDGLPAAERLSLQEASVIGQVFWDQALTALDEHAGTTLPALEKRELILTRTDAEATLHAAGLHEYAFKNAMLHQVTYGTLLKRARCALHGKLAHWFSQLQGLRSNDFLGLTADHFEQAGDEANAAQFHARAAEHAATRFAHDRVLVHVQRALMLLERLHRAALEGTAGQATDQTSSKLRWRLLKVRETTLELQGRRPEQRADLEAMDLVSVELRDDKCSAHTAYRRSYMAMRTADWSEMETQAQRGMQLAQRAGDDVLRLRCLRMVADAHSTKGDWLTGRSLAQDALEQARALGLPDVQALCLNSLGYIAGDLRGDTMAALELDQQALTIANETGDRRGEAIGLGNLGIAWISLGALEQGRKLTEDALQIVRAIGDRAVECNTLGNLSQLALWQGDDQRALSFARAAYDIALAVEARNRQSDALVHMGNAELALGRHAPALEAYTQAHAVALSIQHPRQHDAAVGLARLALAQNETQTALTYVNRMLAHSEPGGNFEGVDQLRLLELTCHRVLERAADPRSRQWLERAHTQLQASALAIPDATLRQGFLANIPHHREIVAAWGSAGPGKV